MRERRGLLGAWKERGLFAAVAVAFVWYSLWLALASPRAGTHPETPGREANDQRYVRRPGTPALPADADAVFAAPEERAYWDGSLRRVWVEPKVERPKVKLRLDPPPPMIPAPPMLLPVPGPTLAFSSALPRWPEVPPVKAEEEAGGEEAPVPAEEPGAP